MNVPYLTVDQMVRVDRAMIEDFGIELIQMMENAGRNLAHLARLRFLEGDPRGKSVVVLAGSGGNGGGAMVCVRRLHIWGAVVTVAPTKLLKDLRGIPAHQMNILQKMGMPVVTADLLKGNEPPDLIIDGIFGYGLSGAPEGVAVGMITWANRTQVPILSLDVPSGLDATAGEIHQPAIVAAATMTLALPKAGLQSEIAADYVGELYLADISVPSELYRRPPIDLSVGPLFALDDIVRLC